MYPLDRRWIYLCTWFTWGKLSQPVFYTLFVGYPYFTFTLVARDSQGLKSINNATCLDCFFVMALRSTTSGLQQWYVSHPHLAAGICPNQVWLWNDKCGILQYRGVLYSVIPAMCVRKLQFVNGSMTCEFICLASDVVNAIRYYSFGSSCVECPKSSLLHSSGNHWGRTIWNATSLRV
jgi:hypothetical protein